LNEVPPGEDIYGFPLNMPYTDIDKIWQEVKHTDIHNIQNDDVEYVLSVAITPYPHFVLSVWVYVGVIFKKPIK
jgi:coiled-coil and C2 domain-containing protein 2A